MCPSGAVLELHAPPRPSRPPTAGGRSLSLPSKQAELVGRLQALVATKAGRRIVYQQKEEGGGNGAADAPAA